MTLYNTATWVMAILILMLLIAIPMAFQQQPQLPGQPGGNFIGKDFEGRISPGIPSSGQGIPQRNLK